jgi:replicative DNA helicase Mcm
MAASVISSTTKWKEFLTRYYKNQIGQLAVSETKNKALVIEFPQVNKFDVRLAEELIANPYMVLAHAEEALSMVDLPVKKEISARIRVAKMPKKTQVRDLRSIDVNRFLSIEGTVRKITDVRPRIIEAAFECARCKNVTIIPQEGGGKFIEPTYCSCNEEKKGVFRLIYRESRFEDYQRIKIQESPDELKGGEQPQTLDINVSDDLAGQVTPGEHITVTGILRSAQKINKDGKTAYFDIYMDGNSVELEEQEYDEVEISPEDEEEIMRLSKDKRVYDKICSSIAPSIYGYEEVKEAIAHQLFSGVVKSLPDGTRIRGDIHVLLVGDPGIAKSQILRYVVKLALRGVYASGKSASSAAQPQRSAGDEFDGPADAGGRCAGAG